MDGFELLLQASEPNNNFSGDLSYSPNKMAYPTSDIRSSLLDPIDSIMMLAEQAVKQENQLNSNSPNVPSWKDYGPYFNGFNTDRKMRAMSEPWTTQDSMNVSLKYGLMGAASSILSLEGGSIKSNNSSSNLSVASPSVNNNSNSFLMNSSSGLLASSNGGPQLEQTLPHMLDKYAAIYNKHGRVGIYTKEERIAIVSRFHEKRKRRVWRKKIRYFCRKNLADRRVRVKGRFVKAGGKVPFEDSVGGEEEVKLMIKLKRGAGGGLVPMEEVDNEDESDGYEDGEYVEAEDDSEEGGHTKSDSNTTNSSNSGEQTSTPPSSTSATVENTCKLHFLSSMLGDYIETELNSNSSKEPAHEEFGPGGKKMRRHSIAY